MLMLPVAQRRRDSVTWSLNAGISRVTTRSLLVTKIGLILKAEALPWIDQLRMFQCNRSHRKSFAPDAIKKATALAIDVLPSLPMRHRVRPPLQ